MKGFALTGVCGYVAPRHLQAIRETGNRLVAAYDLSDSAGILDRYFPEAAFTTSEQEFAAQLADEAGAGRLNYLSVCTPNHVHEEQVSLGMRSGLDVICEKPLLLDPSHVEQLLRLEEQTGKRVYNILQLRLHPQIQALRAEMATRSGKDKPEVELTYITTRGRWYHHSWKGRAELSGGIATNIGIHFFDMLIWIFGHVQHQEVHRYTPEQASGLIELEGAHVRWFLSIRSEDLPPAVRERGQYNYRCMHVGNRSIEFTSGFEDLHVRSYEAILAGAGFGIRDAYPSLVLAQQIRSGVTSKHISDVHPFINH